MSTYAVEAAKASMAVELMSVRMDDDWSDQERKNTEDMSR